MLPVEAQPTALVPTKLASVMPTVMPKIFEGAGRVPSQVLEPERAQAGKLRGALPAHQWRVAFRQRNHFIGGILRKKVAEAPDAADVAWIARDPPLSPLPLKSRQGQEQLYRPPLPANRRIVGRPEPGRATPVQPRIR